MTLHQLCELLEVPPAELAQDIEHLRRSLRHSDLELVVDPARCRKCGFLFRADKLRRPGKCANCRSTWISDPLIGIRSR